MSSETPGPTPAPVRTPTRWPLLFVGLIPGIVLLVVAHNGGGGEVEMLGLAYLADLILGLVALFQRGYRWAGVGLIIGAVPGIIGFGIIMEFLESCRGPDSHCIVF